MPYASPKACACGRAVKARHRCPRCESVRQRRQQERRGSFRQRGYTVAWDRLRQLVLLEEPICRKCAAHGKIEGARTVDHVLAVSKGGAMFDRRNLQPLCDRCNVAKSLAEDGWLGRQRTSPGGAKEVGG